jgi:phage/plasmid-like protein (TIGR03299 family)
MSHEITSEDELVLTREPAWHGLGTVVQSAPTPREALKLADLEWTVDRRPVYADAGRVQEGDEVHGLSHPENLKRVPDRFALQRSDTGRILEVVSGDYRVFQNTELADLIDALAVDGAMARAESAGSFRQGRRVFFLIQRGAFKLAARDEVRQYVLLSNAHDGTASVRMIPTDVRVVCANTLALAERSAGFAIRHSASMADRVAAAKRALSLSDVGSGQLRKAAERMAALKLDADDVRRFFLAVYSEAVGIIPARADSDAERRAQAKAVDTVAQWVANLDSRRNTGTGTEGTLWHAFNAVTEWSDHARTVRGGGRNSEARTQSNLFGTSAAFKAKAMRAALALAT